jgi:predicted RNA binding protein YcfA (HicA-like mRNA interferase family)
LKSSQVVARIEAAGWKKIRSEGSHAVFEHPKYGRRSTAFGVPSKEVNKRRLLEVVREFHLTEIETAKIEARLAEAKRRPEPARVSLARVVPEPQSVSEMSDQEIRLLWAQLHKEHGVTQFKLASDLNMTFGELSDFLYHGQSLRPSHRIDMVDRMTNYERQFKLTRNRAELLKRGYGARTGSQNAIDPFLAVVREALQKTLDGTGITITDLANTIGIGASVIHGIKSGKSKTLHPAGKAKLQKWYEENWSEPVAEAPTEAAEPAKEPEQSFTPDPIDNELVAIQIVLNAVKPLGANVAKRALRYVLDRMEG